MFKKIHYKWGVVFFQNGIWEKPFRIKLKPLDGKAEYST